MPNMRRAISHKLQAWSESSHRNTTSWQPVVY